MPRSASSQPAEAALGRLRTTVRFPGRFTLAIFLRGLSAVLLASSAFRAYRKFVRADEISKSPAENSPARSSWSEKTSGCVPVIPAFPRPAARTALRPSVGALPPRACPAEPLHGMPGTAPAHPELLRKLP